MISKNRASLIISNINNNAAGIEEILLSFHLLLSKLLALPRYGSPDTIVADKKMITVLRGSIFNRTHVRLKDLHHKWSNIEEGLKELSHLFPDFRFSNLSGDDFSLCIFSEVWWKHYTTHKDMIRVTLNDIDRKLSILPEGEFYHTAKIGREGVDPKKVTQLKIRIDGFLDVISKFKIKHP